MKGLTAEEVKRRLEWKQEEKTVTLTQGQWSTLTMFLAISTNYRKEETEAWEEMSKEKNEDGSPKYEHAASNAAFWHGMMEDLESIEKKINGVFNGGVISGNTSVE